MSICDKDCLHCPYPDCINDEMDAEDWRQAREIEEYVRPKTAAERAIAAKKREYREANRESIAAKKREYYEANRESIAAKQREYYEANRERYNDYMRRYMAERRRRLR